MCFIVVSTGLIGLNICCCIITYMNTVYQEHPVCLKDDTARITVIIALDKAKDKTDQKTPRFRKTKTKYTKEEVDKWFENELKNAPDEKLTHVYALKHYKMFHTACNIYGGGSWYGFLKAKGFSGERIKSIRKLAKRMGLKHKGAGKEEDRNNLVNWFKENRLDGRSPEELTKEKFKKEFREQWGKIKKYFPHYCGFLRECGVPEKKVQIILDLSISERPDKKVSKARRNEFAKIFKI